MTVEQSPWQTFFDSLPGMLTSYMQLQTQLSDSAETREWQANEAEKDRRYQESLLYSKDLLNKENLLLSELLEAKNDASNLGLNIEGPMSKIGDMFTTQEGSVGFIDQIKSQKADNIRLLSTELGGIQEQKSLFNEGVTIAADVDTNRDAIASLEEIDIYQNTMKELNMDPEYILPKAMVKGIHKGLTDPKIIELQESQRLRDKYGDKLKDLELQTVKDEREMEMVTRYNTEQLVSMTGQHNVADYGVSSYFSNLFKGLSKPEIMTLIEQTPQEYQDIVPQDVDYSDFQNAIAPKMGEIVAANLAANEDMLDALGLTAEDVELSSPEFQNVVAKGVLNAMSGFEQNPNYRFKSDIEITQAKVLEAQAQETIDKDLGVSMVQALPTIKSTFADAEGRLNDDLIESIAEDTGIDEDTVTGIVNSLVVQQDPTTLALMMRQSGDYQKVLNAAGLQTLAGVVAAAGKSKAVSRGKYKSKARITTGQAQKIKDVAKHKQQSNQFISRIEDKHADILSDPLGATGVVGWEGERPMPVPIIALELQKLSLNLLQTSTAEEADAIKARMKELEYFLDQAKKGK